MGKIAKETRCSSSSSQSRNAIGNKQGGYDRLKIWQPLLSLKAGKIHVLGDVLSLKQNGKEEAVVYEIDVH